MRIEGAKVRVPYQGELVTGEVIRYDNTISGAEHYVIRIQEDYPIVAPWHKVQFIHTQGA